MRSANAPGEALGLSEEDRAFYDARETNDSAVKVFGEPTLTLIARGLSATVGMNVAIDWTVRGMVCAEPLLGSGPIKWIPTMGVL